MGQKILLIDADLRKPQLHTRLGIDKLRGLSNLLVDQKIKIEDITQKPNLANNKNWDVLTSGTLPPNPVSLLSSKRMKDLINDLRTNNYYDLIIIDSPPLIGLRFINHFRFCRRFSTNSWDWESPQKLTTRID